MVNQNDPRLVEVQKKRGKVTYGEPFVVKVTKEHVLQGVCLSTNQCALAKAIRALPGFAKSLDMVEVDYRYTYLTFNDGEVFKYVTPEGLQVQMWDRGKLGMELNSKPLRPGVYEFKTPKRSNLTDEQRALLKLRDKIRGDRHSELTRKVTMQ
jgi:hypothetical protein